MNNKSYQNKHNSGFNPIEFEGFKSYVERGTHG